MLYILVFDFYHAEGSAFPRLPHRILDSGRIYTARVLNSKYLLSIWQIAIGFGRWQYAAADARREVGRA